jgi:hypothetical protein
MDGFSYLVTLVSVVAGLGLTHALLGLARLVGARRSVRISGIHLAWTASIVLWLVYYWWFTFLLTQIDAWTPWLLLFVLAYGAVVFFLIALLYPDRWEPNNDTFSHFLAERSWFFGTFVGLGCLDLVDTGLKVIVYELPPPPVAPYSLLIVSWLCLGTIGAVTSSRRFHAAFAYVWLIVLAFWLLNAPSRIVA